MYERAKVYGELLLRLAGKGDDWRSRTVLGPTHEEQLAIHLRPPTLLQPFQGFQAQQLANRCDNRYSCLL